MNTKTIKAWIDGVIQEIEVEEMTSPEQGLSVEDRLIELEDKPIIADGNFLVGNGTVDLEEMTPNEVLSHINGASVATMTSDEFNALEETNANTLYVLTDDEESDYGTAFKIVDGTVCTNQNLIQVGGETWYQTELVETLDEPYINEWGWQCCKDEGDASMELYRWIYRCAKEGFSVSQRTLVVNGVENEPIIVDGGDDIGLAISTARGVTDEAAIEANRRAYPADSENYRILNIPLAQFAELTEDTLKKVLYRVKEDNIELFLLYFPQISDTSNTMPIVYNEDGKIQYLYTVFPTEQKRIEMLDVCNSAASFVKDKVYYLYDIESGDKLNEEQRKKIVKVIHDYIILNAELVVSDTVENRGYIKANAYATLSGTNVALCSGYTQAFNFICRMFGINAVYISGTGYKYDGNGGGHAWNAVQMSADGEYVYGDYSTNPVHWSVIDVYWDEPLHETQIGGTPDRDDVIWRYFLDSAAIFAEDGTFPNHTINYEAGYGKLPFTENPSASCPYSGEQTYKWEE